LQINLPDDIPDGSAEVIILIPTPSGDASTKSLMDFLDQLPSRTSMSREAIDARLEQERESWS
jgi:hypothetical protein